MTLYLVRHGATRENLLRKYIGRSDSALCEEGKAQIIHLAQGLPLPKDVLLLASPMLRCVETAALLLPQTLPILIDGLREMDFGLFEGRSADEMEHDDAYAAWVSSGCLDHCPEGEHPAEFRAQCCAALRRLLLDYSHAPNILLVTHGGVIAALLAEFARPKRGFFDTHISNGGCIVCAVAKHEETLCLHIR